MSILPKFIYKFNAMLIKTLQEFLAYVYPKTYM